MIYIQVLMLRFIFVVVACHFVYSCQKEPEDIFKNAPGHTVQLAFQGMVAGDSLLFGSNYSNAFGEMFSVEAFRFYLHKIQFYHSANNNISPSTKDEYFLIDIHDPSANSAELTIEAGAYDRVRFIIGVDSILNVSGAQEGVLDPGKGMFWTWNSGYIMAKLEGQSPSSNAINNKFEYHIGGFSGPYNVIKQVDLSLHYSLIAESGKRSKVLVSADPLKWFKGPYNISINEYPVCIMPGELAWKIANNYVNMFSVESVSREE